MTKKSLRMERTHHSLISQGVEEHEQTLEKHKPFWVFFVGTIGIPTWLMGVLIAGMGIGFTDAMIVIVIGAAVGSFFPGIMAILGPKSRLSSIESSRFALGSLGKRITGVLQWIACVGWDSINNLMAASGLLFFFISIGMPLPLWAVLAILVASQMLIGIYGHHIVQDTAKYTGALLGIAFLALGILAMRSAPAVKESAGPDHVKDLVGGVILLVTYNLAGWTTWTSDYTRYLPKKTPSRDVFLVIFTPIALASAVLMFFGYVTASVVTEQTPDGVVKALQGLSGHFAPILLLLIGLSSIPINAVNDTSASYSLLSIGVRISRPTAAIFGAVLGYIVCILASSTFIDFFENLLSLFAHWMGPWCAVVLVHWFTIGRKEQKTSSGLTVGGWVFILTSVFSVVLFSANSLYNGVLSPYLGGLDAGPYIGFIFAGTLYYIFLNFKTKPSRA